MELEKIIYECGKITKSKGFDPKKTILKQLLLISTEVAEAIEQIQFTDHTDPWLKIFAEEFLENMKEFEETRKSLDLFEESWIVNKEEFLEELADICIRVFSFCSILELSLEKSILEKMEKNKKRSYKHGKKF